jgi:hypothetical protein
MPGYEDSQSHNAWWRRAGAVAMSAIASFYLLDRSAVPGLVRAANAEPVMIPDTSHRWPVIGKFRNRIGGRNPTSSIMVLPVYNYLQENDLGVSGGSYDWSGYALMHLLGLLEDMGAALGTAEYRAESEAVNAVYDRTYLITSADKRHLTALDPARLDRAAVERFFGVASFEEVRQVVDDGLTLLHQLIAALHDNEVLVLHIG